MVFALARYHDNGSLDTSFHHDGKVITDFAEPGYEYVAGLAIDNDDGIVAGGSVNVLTRPENVSHFALARYTEDGNLDPGFGSGGTVVTDFRSSAEEFVFAVRMDNHNRIVLAGRADGYMALARYLPDGTLDASFDRDGKVLTDFRSTEHERASAIAIDRAGRIIVGGTAGTDGDYFALARYRVDGSLDTSFHHDGKVLTNFRSARNEVGRALAIDHGGRIVLGGWAEVERSPGVSGRQFALARYTDRGELDTTFGGDGKVLTDFHSTENERIDALAIDRAGRIVVGGAADDKFALARYLNDGGLDPSFHHDGKVITDFRSTPEEHIYALALDRLGRIVVAGSADGQFALARYTEDGNLDPSFDGDGKVLTDFRSSIGEQAYAVAIDHQGRIVAGGDALLTG